MSDEEKQQHPDQVLADDMAAALEQLAVLVRRQPDVARNLLWDTRGLSGGVHPVPVRNQVLATAKELGITVAATKHTGEGFEGWTLVFGETASLRLLIAGERPPRPHGEERPGTPVPDRVTSL